jgi:hypothetical protein
MLKLARKTVAGIRGGLLSRHTDCGNAREPGCAATTRIVERIAPLLGVLPRHVEAKLP